MEKLGHRVQLAVNGQLGVNAILASWAAADAETTVTPGLHTALFDIVLMDISMPVCEPLHVRLSVSYGPDTLIYRKLTM